MLRLDLLNPTPPCWRVLFVSKEAVIHIDGVNRRVKGALCA